MWQAIVTHMPKWTVLVQAIFLSIVPLLILLAVRQIKTVDGRESRRKERIELLEERDPAEQDARDPSESKDPNVSKNEDESYSEDYEANVTKMRQAIMDMADVNQKSIFLDHLQVRVSLFCVDGLTDKTSMDQNIIKPLLDWGSSDQEEEIPQGDALRDMVIRQVMLVVETEHTQDVKYSLQKVLFGSIVLLIEGTSGVLILGSSKGKTRGVEEPLSESVLRGPRIGFTEVLSDNTALLRRHGESTELAMHSFKVGKRVQKQLMVAYFRDIANSELVEEVKRRIKTIDVDEVMESGYVEQLIEDNFLSPFMQIQNTERPDRVMAALLEGRVAVMLDGTPFALLMPVTYDMMLQSPEDYYERWLSGSLIRLLRFMATAISLFAPALYISFISFHPGLIPTMLVISIVSARQGVPFSTLIEALIMETSIEILREAGLRLPKPIGPAMGIVGGLIIGQAAVNAGIVSPILVIVVAVTAISSFATPVYSSGISMRMLRFAGMFVASIFGLYGVILFFLLLVIHMAKLKSFGLSYLSLTSPRSLRDWKDYMIRAPLHFMKRRPRLLNPKQPKRKG
ncbi:MULTISPECIES: spore germination protein [unclassified Paenibacillus]|uniref:spore germination protein n=1 Tax=unclassified Paenibacillus TaxID=185978 RepID=UPI00384AEB64